MEIEPTADYAAYVEYGTRFMNAQPYMRPAYNAQKGKFKSDMQKLVR
ncbi:MAG: HK97-gp10 family putative phage morphogenesis protein [Dorea sp.]